MKRPTTMQDRGTAYTSKSLALE